MRMNAEWMQRHSPTVGSLVLCCLACAGKGRGDPLDVDLDGQWFRIYVDPAVERITFSTIPAPAELRDPGEEG